MNKVLCMMAVISLSFGAFGCVTNGLECDENTFVNICLDDNTVEFCTYGERAQLKCAASFYCDPEGGDDGAAACVKSSKSK